MIKGNGIRLNAYKLRIIGNRLVKKAFSLWVTGCGLWIKRKIPSNTEIGYAKNGAGLAISAVVHQVNVNELSGNTNVLWFSSKTLHLKEIKGG